MKLNLTVGSLSYGCCDSAWLLPLISIPFVSSSCASIALWGLSYCCASVTRQPKWWCAAELQHFLFSWCFSSVNPLLLNFSIIMNIWFWSVSHFLWWTLLPACGLLSSLGSPLSFVVSFVAHLNYKPKIFLPRSYDAGALFWCFIAVKQLFKSLAGALWCWLALLQQLVSAEP